MTDTKQSECDKEFEKWFTGYDLDCSSNPNNYDCSVAWQACWQHQEKNIGQISGELKLMYQNCEMTFENNIKLKSEIKSLTDRLAEIEGRKCEDCKWSTKDAPLPLNDLQIFCRIICLDLSKDFYCKHFECRDDNKGEVK